jgi:DNA-binding protein YbaB
MDEETNASFREIAGGYRRRLDELRQMQHDVRQVTATARTRDGLVSVEVGPQGQLRDIRFDPRVYERMSPQRLARTIKELTGEASNEAAGQAKQITAAFLPEDLVARLRDGEEDLTAFLPDAPSIPDDVQE